jgi:hypothetical protein
MARAIDRPHRGAIAELVRLGERKQGWDSYDGAAVDREALLTAIGVVNRLDEFGRVPEPEVGALADGRVLLRWLTDDREVEILFRERGGDFLVRRLDNDTIIEEKSLVAIDVLKDVISAHVLGRRKLEHTTKPNC